MYNLNRNSVTLFYSSYKGYKESYPQQTKVNAIYNHYTWLHFVTPLNHENVIYTPYTAMSRPALGPNQHPIQCVLGSLPGCKEAGPQIWPLTSI
jgi:hypothetical protein